MGYSLASITLIAVLSAAAGVCLTSMHSVARKLVPFSGGVLIGVALFWVLPEMAVFLRWQGALMWTIAGVALLWGIDRFLYPVCPSCSRTHEHASCKTRLHGFAAPLLAAAALHSSLDGWSVAASHTSSQMWAGFGPALVFGVGFHKIPEGLALGVIARASLKSRAAALAWCCAAEASTLVGGGLEIWMGPHIEAQSLRILLALAGGSFLYLGGHAIHGEVRRSGRVPAFLPALTGVFGSSVLRFFVP